MMRQQPGRKKWHSCVSRPGSGSEPKVGRLHNWAAVHSSQGGEGVSVALGGGAPPKGNQTPTPQMLVLHRCKCGKGVPGSRRWSLTTINQ